MVLGILYLLYPFLVKLTISASVKIKLFQKELQNFYYSEYAVIVVPSIIY